MTIYKRIKTPKTHFNQKRKKMHIHQWIYENHFKCCLLPYANIHHIDGDKDNNDPQNLMGFVNISKHRTYENGSDKRICLKCKSNKTYTDKYNFPQWQKFPNGFMCVKCWCDIGRPKFKDRGFVDITLRKPKNDNTITTYSEMEITVNSHFKNNKVFTIKH